MCKMEICDIVTEQYAKQKAPKNRARSAEYREWREVLGGLLIIIWVSGEIAAKQLMRETLKETA